MTLRDLKYAIAVAETRHFGKAAALCFVSQPTLSGQIKKREAELGAVIFERASRAAAVTAAGVVAPARRSMAPAAAIAQRAPAPRAPLAGPLRRGAPACCR